MLYWESRQGLHYKFQFQFHKPVSSNKTANANNTSLSFCKLFFCVGSFNLQLELDLGQIQVKREKCKIPYSHSLIILPRIEVDM